VFQGSNNKKEKKKNNSGEDDLTYGPRDNVIGNKSSSIKLYLIFLRENSTNSCGGQDQGRNFGHGLLLSRLSCRNYGPVYGTSALLWKFMQSRMQGDKVHSLFPN
jgi:hypothetical protein